MSTFLDAALATAETLNINPQTAAISFLIHGTRNKKAVEVIHQTMPSLCERFAQQVGLSPEAVNYCFLEFLTPSLPESLEAYAQQGKKQLYILPLLLFPGTHLYDDIPEAAEAIESAYPEVKVIAAGHIGVEDAEMVALMLKRLTGITVQS